MSKNWCKNESPDSHQHVGPKLNWIHAMQSLMHVDKYGIIGPYSLFGGIVRYTWVKLVMLIRLFHAKILDANN